MTPPSGTARKAGSKAYRVPDRSVLNVSSSLRRLVSLVVGCVLLALCCAKTAVAQDLFLRRWNSVGAWSACASNSGLLFDQFDSSHALDGAAGALWGDTLQGGTQAKIFGAGLWFGGTRMVAGRAVPHVTYAYEPDHIGTLFVPGSVLYDGRSIDSSQRAREKYRLYRSDDLVGEPWPVRDVHGEGHYIDDPTLRTSVGPAYHIGDQELFAIYKDEATGTASDPNPWPFDLEVRSTISFWQSGLLRDAIIVHNELIYRGSDTVFGPVIGLALDGDINDPNDDETLTIQSEGVWTSMFYTHGSGRDPVLGVTLLAGPHAPEEQDPGLTSVTYWSIDQDPMTDSARYTRLTAGRRLRNSGPPADQRMLIASAAAHPVAPGDTLTFDYALYAHTPSGVAPSPQDTLALLNAAIQMEGLFLSHTLHRGVARSHGPGISPSILAETDAADGQLLLSGRHGEHVRIYSVLGACVAEVTLGLAPAGLFADAGVARLDVRSLPSGMYVAMTETSRARFVVRH